MDNEEHNQAKGGWAKARYTKGEEWDGRIRPGVCSDFLTPCYSMHSLCTLAACSHRKFLSHNIDLHVMDFPAVARLSDVSQRYERTRPGFILLPGSAPVSIVVSGRARYSPVAVIPRVISSLIDSSLKLEAG